MSKAKGSFTLPGQAGYEELTLKLAEKWGADVIRDSDGTALSDEILNSGYGIYSTICIIRDHNEWAKQNPDMLQQCFLIAKPVIAEGESIEIPLLDGYFTGQFQVNGKDESVAYWQVFDRTAECEVKTWSYIPQKQAVAVHGCVPWHKYTVNFLACRIWEEISMYNHVTNHWDKEHLMQLDPRYPAVQEYMLGWMDSWCRSHPHTSVVRFTSMFYNFVWIWGQNTRNRNLFTDWASYDFTVSPLALRQFEAKYGYALTSEDFIHQGKLHATHLPADSHKRDWMEFINDFVITFGKKLVDIAHSYHKLAYVFYDDSWVGVEPYGKRFAEFGFDGIIKCVFSGFEVRMCSGVKGVRTHELRLHPYLFPVGLGGAPTFTEGGNPTLDAKKYWLSVRRGLLRAPIDRIGLGGYLSLVEKFPDFVEYIEKISDEFRSIKELHSKGAPYCLKPKVGVLTSWGRLRSWICSGHYHEHPQLDLINLLESLSGLPFQVEFLDFNDIRRGVPDGISVLLNAGFAGSAWSGGDCWKDEKVVASLTEWVHNGGGFIGVNQPSACDGYDRFFRMSHVLGVDEDTGDRICHGRWTYEVQKDNPITLPSSQILMNSRVYLTDESTQVYAKKEGVPTLTCNRFGKGMGIYMGGYVHSVENTRMLLRAVLTAAGENERQAYLTDNLYTECAWYPPSGKLVFINNSNQVQSAQVMLENGKIISAQLQAYDAAVADITGISGPAYECRPNK